MLVWIYAADRSATSPGAGNGGEFGQSAGAESGLPVFGNQIVNTQCVRSNVLRAQPSRSHSAPCDRADSKVRRARKSGVGAA